MQLYNARLVQQTKKQFPQTAKLHTTFTIMDQNRVSLKKITYLCWKVWMR